jgi:hypothetical protein
MDFFLVEIYQSQIYRLPAMGYESFIIGILAIPSALTILMGWHQSMHRSKIGLDLMVANYVLESSGVAIVIGYDMTGLRFGL